MKKRVLQIIGSFHQGGSERQAIGLSRLLKNDGTFDIFAATLNKDGVLRDEIEAIGLPEIPEFRLTSFYNLNFARQIRLCAKYLKESKIDIVHTHDFYTNVFGMAAATLAGVKVRIASKRETGGMRSRSQNLIERLAFGRANAIVVNSLSVRDYLEKSGIVAAKMRLIYNGLDLEVFGTENSNVLDFLSANRLPQDAGGRFITLVANLRHAVKNVPMFLRAAATVVSVHPQTHFVIAGEGELQSDLLDLAVSLKVDANVYFIGRCTEIARLLAASYACVLTSTAEGFSNAIIEYMAAGKPVVATDVGGAREAIADGISGFIVPSDDHEELSRKLIELLDDEQKAVAFGVEGKRIATENFSREAQLSNTLNLYNSLLR